MPNTTRETDELWSDEICALVDCAFETVSRNPSDHETAIAYRTAIATVLTRLTELEAERDRLKSAVSRLERNCLALTEDAEAAEEAGRQKATAEIVAWLDNEARQTPADVSKGLYYAALCIVSGHHLTTGKAQ